MKNDKTINEKYKLKSQRTLGVHKGAQRINKQASVLEFASYTERGFTGFHGGLMLQIFVDLCVFSVDPGVNSYRSINEFLQI